MSQPSPKLDALRAMREREAEAQEDALKAQKKDEAKAKAKDKK
jgi:hypothetical protein